MKDERAKRATNAALKPGDLVAVDPAYLPVLEQTREQMSPRGVTLPACLEPGDLWLKYWMLSSTGYVKWLLYHRTYRSGGESLRLLGYFITEFLPDDKGSGKQKIKPCTTHGKRVVVNHKVTGVDAREVIVYIDALGLPLPIPPERWAMVGT